MARPVAPLTGNAKTGRAANLTYHFAVNTATAQKRPWIVISHHFGGNSTTSQRHVNALNSMGFDCVTFNFSWHGTGTRLQNVPRFLNPLKDLPFNLMERWSREIDDVLETLDAQAPPRKKVIFSFSGPAASALICIAARMQGPDDVVGFICDSGPFVDPKSCTRLMIEQIYGFKAPLKREIVLTFMMLGWGAHHDRKLREALDEISRLSPDFPILSFRGIQDSIVPIANIRRAMDDHGLKGLTAADLPSGHLAGMRDHPEQYKSILTAFLGNFTEKAS